MLTVLIVGAGKSATVLIETLLKHTVKRTNPWRVIVADADENMLLQKTRRFPNAEIAVFDVQNAAARAKLVQQADLVVSLMPPQLHILLAHDCLQFRKHLITSSYASPEMHELNEYAKRAGLMFMCEMGLDPGIDHMTAGHIINSIHRVRSEIVSFKSYCGGLVSPRSDDNPWHYKISWNPLNIVNAGKDGARFINEGQVSELSYAEMFAQTNTIQCDGMGELAYYPNRDSTNYLELYNLEGTQNFLRATLRHPDFIRGWHLLASMGLTNTQLEFDTDGMTYIDWVKLSVDYNDPTQRVTEFIWQKYGVNDEHLRGMIEWLGVFSGEVIGKGRQTSGQILLGILERKWKMKESDRDIVVMQHEVEYTYQDSNELSRFVSSMVIEGTDAEHSAMAKTVGLPMAILAELVMTKTIKMPTGVLIPTMPEIYRPVLIRLVKHGIAFTDTVYA